MILPKSLSIAPAETKTHKTTIGFIAYRPVKSRFRHRRQTKYFLANAIAARRTSQPHWGRHDAFGPTMACWLALLLPPAAAWGENIYTYAGNDGVIYLGNAPAGRHLELGSSAQQSVAAATPRAAPFSAPRFIEIIRHAAHANGLDGALLDAVISVESEYNPRATSKKGALGLMQLTPETATRYGVVDAYDPSQNIHGGARHLRHLLVLFGGDVSLALAAYNAGEAAVTRHGNRIPPFRETSAYVSRVLACYRQYQTTRRY